MALKKPRVCGLGALLTHILRGMLARSDFRCCCSRAEVSGRGQDFRNPTPTRTPVVNHSMRQTCRVTDFAAFGARLRSRTAPCTFRIQYRASQTSHRSSPQSTVSKRKSVKRHERKENPYGAALWKLLRSGAPLCAVPLVIILPHFDLHVFHNDSNKA